MTSRRFPLVAREGWPFILTVLLVAIAATRLGGVALLLPALLLLAVLVVLFRDPPRDIPSRPLAIVSPVDGRILVVEPTDRGALQREAIRILMNVNHIGAYTMRSPVEGKVLNLRDNLSDGSRLTGMSGLWVRTDEGDDVVVMLQGPKRIGSPRAFIGYGERLGQGQRCAFIRLARRVEIFIPLNSRVSVEVGQRVRAGSDVLGLLVHK